MSIQLVQTRQRHRSVRLTCWIALATMALLASSAAPAAAPAEALPTSAELHKMFDDAQYQPLLAKLARVLQLKGDAAKPYDRVELETLRADALLELKQQSSAVAALNDAVKAINEQTDEKLAAQARAMQVLLKRAQAYSYLPRTAPKGETPAPINLLDVTKRKAAYVALLEDMRAEVAAKAKAAKAGKTLPPIVEAVRGITGMRAVELMAKGTDADSQKLADDLAAQAKALMGDASTAMAKRAKEIDADANSIIPNLNNNAANNGRTNTGRAGTNNNQTTTSYKKGLDTRSINELKEIIDNSTKVQSVAIDFEQVSKQNAAGFKEIADSADKTAKAASVTLKADYSGTQAK